MILRTLPFECLALPLKLVNWSSSKYSPRNSLEKEYCVFLDLITIISVAQGRVKTSQEEDFFDVIAYETWFDVKLKFLLFVCFPKSFWSTLRKTCAVTKDQDHQR